jgi:hypothetical protein
MPFGPCPRQRLGASPLFAFLERSFPAVRGGRETPKVPSRLIDGEAVRYKRPESHRFALPHPSGTPQDPSTWTARTGDESRGG